MEKKLDTTIRILQAKSWQDCQPGSHCRCGKTQVRHSLAVMAQLPAKGSANHSANLSASLQSLAVCSALTWEHGVQKLCVS